MKNANESDKQNALNKPAPKLPAEKKPSKSALELFNALAAEQKAAAKKADQYKIQIQGKLSHSERVEAFYFFCKNQEYDSGGNTRKRLLRSIDDVSLVSVYDFKSKFPISLVRLINIRLLPKKENTNGFRIT